MNDSANGYRPLLGRAHRHGRWRLHAHRHSGPHTHGAARSAHDSRARGGAGESHEHTHHDGAYADHGHSHEHRHHDGAHAGHGHSHGLVDASILRSRAGVRAVSLSFAVLGVAALAQTVLFLLTDSVALLADLIHNFGDALTAVPLGIAFVMRSRRAERYAGSAVVAAIFISACVAGYESVRRVLNPAPPDHLAVLAMAGAIGYVGNFVAAQVRLNAGRRLDSAALIADGHHARADAYVSLAVIASAAVVAIGLPIADPLIGVAITLVILRITWQSWGVIRAGDHDH